MGTPHVLLTGFEPFAGDDTNPSWLLARELHGQHIAGALVQSVQLPCVFGQALTDLQAVILRDKPRLVLALGLAAGRATMSVERVAINVDDARIPDNAGRQPVDRPVHTGAPAAYFSTLPIKSMVHEMHLAGVPAEVSQSAGTFVCNHVFFGLMHLIRRKRLVRGGFMHVPLLADQAQAMAQPGLDFDTQLLGLRVAVHTALTISQDRKDPGGSVA